MTLLELNKIISGSYMEKKKTVYQKADGLEKLVQDFQEVMQIDGGFYSRFKYTEIAKEFYKACPLFTKLIPKGMQEDVFYAAKCGYLLEGVPSKLTYLLNKAFKEYDTPNNGVSMVAAVSLKPFLAEGSLAEGLTVKDAIEGVLGKSYQVLSDANRAVKYNDCYEVYVENVDRVVILPLEYEKYLASRQDLLTVEYNSGIGVCLCGKPLRTYCGKFGITENEFDLRKCI